MKHKLRGDLAAPKALLHTTSTAGPRVALPAQDALGSSCLQIAEHPGVNIDLAPRDKTSDHATRSARLFSTSLGLRSQVPVPETSSGHTDSGQTGRRVPKQHALRLLLVLHAAKIPFGTKLNFDFT